MHVAVLDFPSIPMPFAWTRNESAPVILGQHNFFKLFDVTFMGADLTFEIKPHRPLHS